MENPDTEATMNLCVAALKFKREQGVLYFSLDACADLYFKLRPYLRKWANKDGAPVVKWRNDKSDHLIPSFEQFINYYKISLY